MVRGFIGMRAGRRPTHARSGALRVSTMSGGCKVVCCPSCGYSFPQENAGLAGRLKQFLQRRRAGGGAP